MFRLRLGGDPHQTDAGINSQELNLICFEHQIDRVSNKKSLENYRNANLVYFYERQDSEHEHI